MDRGASSGVRECNQPVFSHGGTEPAQDPLGWPGHPAKLDDDTHKGGGPRFLHLRRMKSLDRAGAFEEDATRRETGKDEGPRGPPSSRGTPMRGSHHSMKEMNVADKVPPAAQGHCTPSPAWDP